jgi:hypothetical protein
MAQSRACVMGIAGRVVNNSDGISLEWMDAEWRRVEPGRHGGGGEHYCTVRPTSGTGDVKCKQAEGAGVKYGKDKEWHGVTKEGGSQRAGVIREVWGRRERNKMLK